MGYFPRDHPYLHMSYSKERDELAEMFGAAPVKRKSGYLNDLVDPVDSQPQLMAQPVTQAETQAESPKPQQGADSSEQSSVPLETRRPVKLRPPADVLPHPLERDPAPPRAAAQPRVTSSPPEPVIEDEEFLSYDPDDMPDFSDLHFNSRLTEKPAPTKSQTPKPLPEPRAQESRAPLPVPAVAPTVAPAVAPPEKQIRAEARPAPTPTTPEKSFREAAKNSEISFVSDSTSRPSLDTDFLLDTHGLVKIYDGRTVVNGVDINVRPGEIVGLLGPNGAGKTTSFYMIVGLVPPNAGQVRFNGDDVTTMPMYQRARLGMGYLPQEESIFRKMTVEENIMAVMETLSIPRKEQISRCNELLERFSITHIRKNIALTCSGGEKRRLTIARSLVTTPRLLMLDEPFSGVDPIAVNEIQNIVEDLRKTGLAILITDHNARQTLELVDRAYLIYEGKVLREGSRDFLINDPVSRELYLGDRFTM